MYGISMDTASKYEYEFYTIISVLIDKKGGKIYKKAEQEG